jgi:hypothetical protein
MFAKSVASVKGLIAPASRSIRRWPDPISGGRARLSFSDNSPAARGWQAVLKEGEHHEHS